MGNAMMAASGATNNTRSSVHRQSASKVGFPAIADLGAGAERQTSLIKFVEGVGVVVEYDAAAEIPFAVLLQQVAFVMAGRELPAVAVAGDQYQQVAGGARPLAGKLDSEIGDHVAKLPAGLALRGETAGEGADRLVSGDLSDHRAFEHGIGGETADNGFDIAGVECHCVAHEQIVDGEPIFETWHAGGSRIARRPHRRRPVPMAEVGPGLRRESDYGSRVPS